MINKLHSSAANNVNPQFPKLPPQKKTSSQITLLAKAILQKFGKFFSDLFCLLHFKKRKIEKNEIHVDQKAKGEFVSKKDTKASVHQLAVETKLICAPKLNSGTISNVSPGKDIKTGNNSEARIEKSLDGELLKSQALVSNTVSELSHENLTQENVSENAKKIVNAETISNVIPSKDIKTGNNSEAQIEKSLDGELLKNQAFVFNAFLELSHDDLTKENVSENAKKIVNFIEDSEVSLLEYLQAFRKQDHESYFKLLNNVVKTEDNLLISKFIIDKASLTEFLENFNDIKLLFQEEVVVANKCLLSAFIPYYNILFQSGLNKEFKTPEDANKEIFFDILYHQIFDEITIDEYNFQELIMLSNKLGVGRVKDKCDSWLAQNIHDVANFDEILLFTSEYKLETTIKKMLHSGESYYLHFKTFTGRVSSYHPAFPLAISSIKTIIAADHQVDPSRVRFIYSGQVLNDNLILDPANTSNGIVVSISLSK